MITWATIEDAIHAWISGASGLECVWEASGGPRPQAPYISLSASVKRVGQDRLDYFDNPIPTPGAEIIERVLGKRELALTVKCWGGDATREGRPSAILEDVNSKSLLGAFRDSLSAVGWAPARFDPVLEVGGLIGGRKFEPRAECRCFGFVASQVQASHTFIELVDIERLSPV